MKFELFRYIYMGFRKQNEMSQSMKFDFVNLTFKKKEKKELVLHDYKLWNKKEFIISKMICKLVFIMNLIL